MPRKILHPWKRQCHFHHRIILKSFINWVIMHMFKWIINVEIYTTFSKTLKMTHTFAYCLTAYEELGYLKGMQTATLRMYIIQTPANRSVDSNHQRRWHLSYWNSCSSWHSSMLRLDFFCLSQRHSLHHTQGRLNWSEMRIRYSSQIGKNWIMFLSTHITPYNKV